MLAVAPRSVGAYTLEGVLGGGGGGTVFRGRHEGSGLPVAIKLLRGGERSALAGLRREIEALSILRHPGVIDVIDHGVHDGWPWYAMELVEGESLRAAMAHLGPSPLLRPLLRSMARLCETLAFVHAEGFVHRDLNPDNVVLRPCGAPVLIDFGLAAATPGATHRERLLTIDDLGGRVSYMAPEQIRGDLIDARTDLYALGCILYELIAGHVPFVGSARDVLRAHLETPAPALRISPRCPGPLAQLVGGLLEKDPRDRPGYATHVLRVLRQLSADGTALAETPPTSVPVPRQRVYLNRPAWVGRAIELGRVNEWVDQAMRGQGKVVAIFGESGIGKTRLALEAATRARERGAAVYAGGAQAAMGASGLGGGGASLAPLRPILASVARHCQEVGVVETERLCAVGLGLLASFDPDLAALLGQVAVPAATSPQSYRRAIFDALTGVLCCIAERGSVLLVLDDMHWSDDFTAVWIASLARDERIAKSRLLVLICARSEAIEPQAESILRLPDLASLVLGPLTSGDIGRMLRDTLRTAMRDHEGLDVVVEHAGGNPFFASEYLSLVVTEKSAGDLADRPFDLDLSQLAVPRSIADLLEMRLGRLDSVTRAVAELAAVLGRELPEHWLEQVTTTGAHAGAVQQMLRLRILESLGGSLRFVHDKIREGLLEHLLPDRRRSLSLQAAGVLERDLAVESFAQGRSRLYPSLARHLLVAGEVVRAVEYLELAADDARATYSNTEVVEYLSLAVEHASAAAITPGRKALWLRQLGEAKNALGHADAGRSHLREALVLLGHPFPATRPALAVRLALELGRQALRRWFDPTSATDRPPRPDVARRLTEAARCHEGIAYLLSDQVAALCAGIAALNLAERADAVAELERGYATMAVAMGIVGWPEAADAYFKLAHTATARSNQAGSRVWALMLEGYHGISQGQLERAHAAVHAGADLALRIGEHRRREDCLSLLSEIAVFRGEDALAFGHADELGTSARKRGDRQTELWAATNHARMSIILGDFANARARLEAVRPDEQRSTATDFIMFKGLRALACWHCGDRPLALELACHTVDLAGSADPTFFFGLHGLWPALDVLIEAGAASTGADQRALVLEAGLRVLRRLARLHPIARPRYWLAEGKRRRLLGLRSPGTAFGKAEEHARRLGLPRERQLALQAWSP